MFLGKLVVKKWTQTRDSWMRSIKKRGKSSDPSTKRSRLYIYRKEMSFLKKVIDRAVTRETTNELTIRIEGNDEETRTEENESGTARNEENFKDTVRKECISDTQRKRKTSEEDEKKSFDNRQANLAPKEDSENHHLLFFKSILPFSSLFDDDQTLEFQSSVLNSLQKIKRQRKTPLNNKSHNQRNYYEWLSGHSGYTSRQQTKFSP